MRAFRHASLALKLPIAIALLVLLACGAVAAAAYVHVRASAFEVADERLSGVADQVSTILAMSVATRAQSLQVLADGAVVRDFVSAPSAEGKAAIRAMLAGLPVTKDRNGFRIFSSSPSAHFESEGWEKISSDDAWAAPAATRGRKWMVSPISRGDTGLYYELVAPIAAGSSVSAHLVERRWLGPAAPGIELLLGLIGKDAKLLFGNVGGDLWADFERAPIAMPDAVGGRLVTVTLDGREYAVRGTAVAGTPWVAAAALPLEPVLTRVRDFQRQAGTMTAVIVMAAAVLGWIVSRRITVPLRTLAESAARIDVDTEAASPAAPRRGDEVARLSASFDAMSQRVDDSRRQLAALVGDLEERVRRRTEALEATNKELEAFSYSVSHDLRAPVRAISGFATILASEHAESMTDDARRCVEVITRRSRQMGQLIDDLLAFSRVGRQRLSHQKVDMARLAAAAIDEVRAAHPARQIEFVVGDLPPVEGESSLLQQAFTNLVQNAVKFSAPRDLARVEIGWMAGEGEDIFFVRDNGVGFDMQYVDKLFGVFQRLHRADEFEGTGVGLAIVQRVAQRHGGRAWAEGAVDHGATFYFSIGRDREETT